MTADFRFHFIGFLLGGLNYNLMTYMNAIKKSKCHYKLGKIIRIKLMRMLYCDHFHLSISSFRR